MLTQRENEVRQTLDDRYAALTGRTAVNDADLCYYLGDSAEYQTWSAISNKIPTMRNRGGIIWWPHLMRFTVPRERLLYLGMPVDASYCAGLGVPIMGTSDEQRSADFAGNAMHLMNVALVELIVLSSFAEVDVQRLP